MFSWFKKPLTTIEDNKETEDVIKEEITKIVNDAFTASLAEINELDTAKGSASISVSNTVKHENNIIQDYE